MTFGRRISSLPADPQQSSFQWRRRVRRVGVATVAVRACVALSSLAWIGCDARADDRTQEAERSRRTAARIEAEWPLVGPGPVTDFVRALGARLGRTAGRTQFPWHFVLFRHRAANAFAIGGGRVYVSDGAIEVCGTEAELAAILAHEMGHQIAGHFRVERSSEYEPARPPKNRNARIGSVIHEFDPAKEIEADRVSIRILQAAGYAPEAALDLARRLAPQVPPGAAPFDQRRLDALSALVKGAARKGRTDSREFRTLRRQLMEAESP